MSPLEPQTVLLQMFVVHEMQRKCSTIELFLFLHMSVVCICMSVYVLVNARSLLTEARGRYWVFTSLHSTLFPCEYC